mmetsp:Transcript_79326/g.92721  ORF Transcript_79326/g.92721 Transcript_79326/m.92721 type:complete len:266 (+) Transcript_79326:11-808(+)
MIMATPMKTIERHTPLVSVAVCCTQCTPIELNVHGFVHGAQGSDGRGNGTLSENPVLCHQIAAVCICKSQAPRDVVRVHNGVENDVMQRVVRAKFGCAIFRPLVDQRMSCFGRSVHCRLEWFSTLGMHAHELLTVLGPVGPLRSVFALNGHPRHSSNGAWIVEVGDSHLGRPRYVFIKLLRSNGPWLQQHVVTNIQNSLERRGLVHHVVSNDASHSTVLFVSVDNVKSFDADAMDLGRLGAAKVHVLEEGPVVVVYISSQVVSRR